MAIEEKTGIETLVAIRCLQIAPLFPVGVYIAILIVYYREFTPIITDGVILTLITIILAVVGVISIGLAYFLPKWMIKRYKQKMQLSKGLVFGYIVRCILFILVAVCGLVLGPLGAGWAITLPFFIVVFGAMILTFPTKERLKKLLEY